MPVYPSLPVDVHLDLQKSMTPSETITYMRERLVQAEEMAAELATRILIEYGPELGGKIFDEAGVAKWKLKFDPERIAAEDLKGLERRHSLSVVVRDVERNLGRLSRHAEWKQAVIRLPGVEAAAAASAVAP